MKKLPLLILALSLFACNDQKKTSSDEKSEVPKPAEAQSFAYQPFPDGYGYLQDSSQLAEAVANEDFSTVRAHGWKLWAGITQESSEIDWPIWFTWPNTKPAFSKASVGLGENVSAAPKSLIQINIENITYDTAFSSFLPIYPIPQPVVDKYGSNFSIGSRFLFNGDILIPTEALSNEAYDWIRNDSLYLQSQLQKLYEEKLHILNSPTKFISTKHMYWPVKKDSISALPVWDFDFPPNYEKYAGYENWNTLVAIDPSGKYVGKMLPVTYLHGVLNPDSTKIAPVTKDAEVVSIDNFYSHQVTQDEWDNLFDDADRAILSASSYWAHNQPFEPGDYLVTVAMHVNTKELPTWAMQSVWWSNKPDESKYSEDRPDLPQAKGPWKNYLMTTSYGIVDPVTKKLPVEMNPYIELVIHPVGTSCQNCHVRAGWPKAPTGMGTPGMASYQNDDCPDLLEPLDIDADCLKEYLLTDFSWIIADQAVK